MVTDRDRHELFSVPQAQLGAGPADTLMALLPPVGWADVATKSDVRGLGTGLRAEIAELRAELRGEMAELRGEMALLRGHVDSLLPKQIAANIASMIGVAGLVIGAAHFL